MNIIIIRKGNGSSFMPLFRKECLSKYLRTECKRQLKFNLSPNNKKYRHERETQGIPPEQDPRPGLDQFRKEGKRWEIAKLADLREIFGSEQIIGNPATIEENEIKYNKMELEIGLTNASADLFLVEQQFDVSQKFLDDLGISSYKELFNLDFSEIRPDIIHIISAGTYKRYITPNGEVKRLQENDDRLQLRVIDIKVTANPSKSYLAEVAYYMMALSGWLIDNNLDDKFVVIPEGSIWSGSHEASNLIKCRIRIIDEEGRQPNYEELYAAFEEDLEIVPFEVFAVRIKKFFLEDLPDIIITNWEDLDYHVDNRCKNCNYLGFSWKSEPIYNDNHCLIKAKNENHLSRIFGISVGARKSLEEDTDISNVSELLEREGEDEIYKLHQKLRENRDIIPARASSLENNEINIVMENRSSAEMPKWADLRIYISIDFDISSAITFAIGLKAFWREPTEYGQSTENFHSWPQRGAHVFRIDQRDTNIERREFINFLDTLDNILSEARRFNQDTTYQIYIWDKTQYNHLTRIISRHLDALMNQDGLNNLLWLFPPEEILQNWETVTRRSPLTILSDVINSHLAVPIPHYYNIFDTARNYHRHDLSENIARFRVHPLFEDPLSNQIPSERAHEIWTRTIQPYWANQLDIVRETVTKKISALETIVSRLETDIRQTLYQKAPTIAIRPPRTIPRMSPEGNLWFLHQKLNYAFNELEVHRIRAMPPHMREAKFRSARLVNRIVGREANIILEELQIEENENIRIYRMRETSKEVKLREGDFNFALAPENNQSFLNSKLIRFIHGNQTLMSLFDNRLLNSRMEDLTGVTIKAIDRENLIIVVEHNNRGISLDEIENYNLANLNINVLLDPKFLDFFTGKLKDCLRAIGRPYRDSDERLLQITGQINTRGARISQISPPVDFIWNVQETATTLLSRDLSMIKDQIVNSSFNLNNTQWEAWEDAMSKRIQLIWGPPGTGKSRTLQGIAIGSVILAHNQNENKRILICSANYKAIDNVFKYVNVFIKSNLPETDCQIYRLRSIHSQPPMESDVDLAYDGSSQSSKKRLRNLFNELVNNNSIHVIASTPSQIYNLMKVGNERYLNELFDIIIIDEATQMDVSSAILSLCSVSNGGSLVLAGDLKQLPPIHKVKPPLDFENFVGSIYSYYKDYHNLEEKMLDINYRSNRIIVDFSFNAGYLERLESFSPNLMLNINELPYEKPINWNDELYWTDKWNLLLDPTKPVACFVYPDGRSGQWNQFEANSITALIRHLYGYLKKDLLNQINPLTNDEIIPSNEIYSFKEFWEKGIGVVTPHRAQQGLIINLLQRAFEGEEDYEPSLIRDAVDTVDRFQGQERDIIIASYCLGDPDIIRDEDEFIMSLNRFNVTISRAKAKVIVFVSDEIIDYLSDDYDILENSKLIKDYAEIFCNEWEKLSLYYINENQKIEVKGEYRYRAFN